MMTVPHYTHYTKSPKSQRPACFMFVPHVSIRRTCHSLIDKVRLAKGLNDAVLQLAPVETLC